jgi:hypothetical protein
MKFFKFGKRMYQSIKCIQKVGRKINEVIKRVYKFVKQIYRELVECIDFKEITEEIKKYAQEISLDQILDKVSGLIIISTVVYLAVL